MELTRMPDKSREPIALPADLVEEAGRVSAETGLSIEETIHEAIRLGLPRVRKQLSREEDLSEAAADTWQKLGPPPRVNYDEL